MSATRHFLINILIIDLATVIQYFCQIKKNKNCTSAWKYFTWKCLTIISVKWRFFGSRMVFFSFFTSYALFDLPLTHNNLLWCRNWNKVIVLLFVGKVFSNSKHWKSFAKLVAWTSLNMQLVASQISQIVTKAKSIFDNDNLSLSIKRKHYTIVCWNFKNENSI